MYLQICCGALQWLSESNIIHRNLRPAVILVNARGSIHAQLTGFSDWCQGPQSRGRIGLLKYQAPEMQADLAYDNAVDVYSLCTLTEEALGLTEPALPITRTDLTILVQNGMLQHPEARPKPSETQNVITDLIGGYDVDWSSFSYFVAEKDYVINGVRQEYDDLIAALDLVRVLRAFDPDKFISDRVCSLPHWTRTGTDNQQVSLRSAAKYCHQLDLEDLRSFFLEASAKGRTKGSFQLRWRYGARIYYHGPSLMVNISDITKIGTSQLAIDLKKARCKQQVLGIPHLEGIYVDHAFFEDVCTILRRKDIWQIKVPNLTKSHNPTLERRFVQVRNPQYSIVVTELINPNMILLRAADWMIHLTMLRGVLKAWDRPHDPADFVSLEEALRVSNQDALTSILTHLLGLKTYSEGRSTPIDSAKSMKTSTSYERLEADLFQETELDFHFGARITPRKRTAAERIEDEETANDDTKTRTVHPSITTWLKDVRPSRSITRQNTCRSS